MSIKKATTTPTANIYLSFPFSSEFLKRLNCLIDYM